MALQRHAALAPFSRDHHLALQLARAIQIGGSRHLRDGLPRDRAALVAHVRRVFAEELEPHFGAEETVLLPAVAGRSEALDALARAIVAEHVQMRAALDALTDREASAAAVDALLDALGRQLEAHVRKEERELYEQIQAVLDEPALARISLRVERHLGARKPGAPFTPTA